MSVNKVILVGNLGQDPEIRYTNDGKPICNFSLATSETWKDKNTGERREKTEWHRIVIFGILAEIAGKYLNKGRQVYIEGRLQTRKWQAQDGQDRYTTEVVVDVRGTMQMLGNRDGGGSSQPKSGGGSSKGSGYDNSTGQQGQNQYDSQPPYPGSEGPVSEDDIPF